MSNSPNIRQTQITNLTQISCAEPRNQLVQIPMKIHKQIHLEMHIHTHNPAEGQRHCSSFAGVRSYVHLWARWPLCKQLNKRPIFFYMAQWPHHRNRGCSSYQEGTNVHFSNVHFVLCQNFGLNRLTPPFHAFFPPPLLSQSSPLSELK